MSISASAQTREVLVLPLGSPLCGARSMNVRSSCYLQTHKDRPTKTYRNWRGSALGPMTWDTQHLLQDGCTMLQLPSAPAALAAATMLTVTMVAMVTVLTPLAPAAATPACLLMLLPHLLPHPLLWV